MEPDGPGGEALTNHGEVFTGAEEDFRGGRKQFQAEEAFREKQEDTYRQTGGYSKRNTHRCMGGRQRGLTQQEVQQVKTSPPSSDGSHVWGVILETQEVLSNSNSSSAVREQRSGSANEQHPVRRQGCASISAGCWVILQVTCCCRSSRFRRRFQRFLRLRQSDSLSGNAITEMRDAKFLRRQVSDHRGFNSELKGRKHTKKKPICEIISGRCLEQT